MSWMQKLYEVYQACEQRGLVGKWDETPALLPLYHSTQKAQVEVVIDSEGNWVPGLARAITDKQEQETVIMGDPESLAVAAAIKPKALFEKLIYLAGDYPKYYAKEFKKGSAQQEKPSQKNMQPELYHKAFMEMLQAWCESPYAHPDVLAWYTYLQKGRLIADLVAEGVFQLDESGRLTEKWAGGGKQQEAFIRYRILRDSCEEDCIWQSASISNAFIAHYQTLPVTNDICYAMGELQPIAATSPKYIRYSGDATKLISANDNEGFTYRGRFQTAEEALVVGRDTTEKAHAALKWLIRRQGYRNGEQVVLAFGTGGNEMPSPVEDTLGVVRDPLFADDEMPPTFTLKESIARALTQALHSTSARLDRHAEAIVMGLDSAIEGKGRLAIFYYRELSAQDYFDHILSWHTTCTWLHTYRWVKEGRDDSGKEKGRFIHFTGAPSLMDIVLATYGKQVSDKLKKSALERLLPCVVDSARLPRDIVSTLARRAAQRAALDDGEREKVLSIACALIKKQRVEKKLKGAIDMALDEQYTGRDYLFGRALAYAEMIERAALDQQGEDRITNADRLMVSYTKHPASTLLAIQDKLKNYQNKSRRFDENFFDRWIDGFYDVIDSLKGNGFTNDKLSEEYLLGYASQRMKLKRQYYAIRHNRSNTMQKEEE